MKTLIAKKIGMLQVFSEKGDAKPATVLDVSENYLARVISVDGKRFLEIGKDKVKKPVKSDLGNYKELNFVPRFTSREESTEEIQAGSKIELTIVNAGDEVEITGTTKGKGFAGVVKRHGFKGGPRTHGQSDRERAPGSIGNRTIPGRVYKGKRMAGHMGTITKTVKGLKILMVNPENSTIVVEGSIPGSKNSYLVIKKSK